MAAELIAAGIVAAAVFTALRRPSRRADGPSLARRVGVWLLGRLPLLRGRLERAVVRAGPDCRADAAGIAGRALLFCGAGTLGAVPLLVAGLPGLLVAGVPIAAGLLPLLSLRDRIRRREAAIGRTLPWALDLLTLAVEVGVDFNQALVRVVERGRPGPLRDELALVVRALRMGRSRQEALDELRWRTGHAGVGRFCTAVIQAERLGTPLSRVLRSQAADLRIERCQRAETLAGQAPVKLLLPLLGCIFPSVFLVLLGPIAFALLFGGLP
ncbi:type II secretion system F family protein [Vulgatibacter sp.]|uniref:type II secretion system F family protein n=1 Tax=Vulgatibacter sp. TaxID=1971226 RepID=UPI00356A0F5F